MDNNDSKSKQDAGPKAPFVRLLDLAKGNDQNVQVLSDMLWQIRAHPQLIGFVHVCQHIKQILNLESEGVHFITEHPTLAMWVPLLDWILKDPKKLADTLWEPYLIDSKGQFLADSGSNPILRNTAMSHRFYCLLWDSLRYPTTTTRYRKFLIIQAQMLVAHASVLKYERHEIVRGNEPHENLDARMYDFSVCCWRFEHKKNPWPLALDFLPESLNTNKYMQVINQQLHNNEFEALDQQALFNPRKVKPVTVEGTLTDIVKFLRWGKNPKAHEWIMRAREVHGGIGGRINDRFTSDSPASSGKPAQSEISALGGDSDSNDDQEITLSFSDPDDPYPTPGNFHVINKLRVSKRVKKALLDADEDPIENSHHMQVELAEDEAAAGIARGGGSEKANQLLPWSFDGLSAIEMARLLKGLANVRTQDSTELEFLELRALTETIFWTGSSLDQALVLSVRSQQPEEASGDLSVWIRRDDNGSSSAVWRVRALAPAYRSTRAPVPGKERERKNFIDFEDMGGAHRSILNFIKFAPSALRSDNALVGGGVPSCAKVFQREQEWYKERLTKLLKEIDSTGRLTLGRLSGVMFRRVVECSGGDIVAAAIITNTNHYLASVRIYYATPSADHLRNLHCISVESILQELEEAKWKRAGTRQIDANTVSYAVGSRLCPTKSATQKAIHSLKNKIARQLALGNIEEKQAEFILKHNWFSIYSIWMQMYCIGTRGISTPYLHCSEFDPKTQIGSIADKDSGDNYKRRLVWVPDIVWEQMMNYENYLKILHKKHGLPAPSRKLPCYFLRQRKNSKFKPITVGPARIGAITQTFFPFPANVSRRFCRTELLELSPQFAPVFVDCWTGHWHRGEEPWGPYSSVSYSDYLQQLEGPFQKFFESLGFEPISLEPVI